MGAANDLMVTLLEANLEFVTSTVADMTDKELAERPCPASHPALWQLGHVVAGEAYILGVLDPSFTAPTESFMAAFSDGRNVPASLPDKATILAELKRVRASVIALAQRIDESKLKDASPLPWAKTLGELLMLVPGHATMHIGQIQVLRRKLGKPVLF
ncbi:MAG: DinB family protein [Tepidisphaeraceae bacterium]